jgi:zinc-ribbon domain
MTCPGCQAQVPDDARFCPSCGARLDSGETTPIDLPPSEATPTPIRFVHPEPRLYGVAPPGVAMVVAAALAIIAVGLLIAGSWLLALLVLVIALLLFVPAVMTARHAEDSVVSQRVVAASDSLRGWIGFVGGTAGAWSAAGREVLRLRTEIRRLRPERDDVQFALGDAAYREDASSTAALRARLRDLDDELTSRQAAIDAALEHARRRSRRERRAIQHTERVEAVKSEPSDSSGKDV